MDPSSSEAFIAEAIARGSGEGLPALNGVARMVFLIAEAEVLCDMEGIDTFVDRYGGSGVSELAGAYSAIGANAIASVLQEIANSMPDLPDFLLSRANDQITSRLGYTYEDIVRAVREAQETHQ
jgi:hypothetical protein